MHLKVIPVCSAYLRTSLRQVSSRNNLSGAFRERKNV